MSIVLVVANEPSIARPIEGLVRSIAPLSRVLVSASLKGSLAVLQHITADLVIFQAPTNDQALRFATALRQRQEGIGSVALWQEADGIWFAPTEAGAAKGRLSLEPLGRLVREMLRVRGAPGNAQGASNT